MVFETSIGKTAIDLVKNEAVLNKTADIMGMLFPYAGLAKKAVDMYISEIEKSDMSIEAKMYCVMNTKNTLKKVKNQEKIVDIAMTNAKQDTDFTEKSGVDNEWLERFMDSASFVSSEDMQLIWGKILANEFEEPGTTPPNMIRVLSEITPVLAKAFRKICSMRVWICPLLEDESIEATFQSIVVPYNGHEDAFRKMGVSFNILNELETLGVIKVSTLGGYVSKKIDNDKVLLCIGENLEVANEHNKGEIPIGNVLLTSVGQALCRITEVEEIPNYYDMVREYVIGQGVKFAEEHDFYLVKDGDSLGVERRTS